MQYKGNVPFKKIHDHLEFHIIIFYWKYELFNQLNNLWL